jgi:hypothetical protein
MIRRLRDWLLSWAAPWPPEVGSRPSAAPECPVCGQRIESPRAARVALARTETLLRRRRDALVGAVVQ